MPTREATEEFWREWRRLSRRQQEAFLVAVEKLVADLKAGLGFRPGLRVRGVRGSPGIFELTWADDGRATFQYGPSRVPGEPHVIWRRVGTHSIFDRP